jgi:hypothetical protein
MGNCQLIMVIIFELEDSFSKTAITWTERREYLFGSQAEAKIQFNLLENKFRRDNRTFKTAFAIYDTLDR